MKRVIIIALVICIALAGCSTPKDPTPQQPTPPQQTAEPMLPTPVGTPIVNETTVTNESQTTTGQTNDTRSKPIKTTATESPGDIVLPACKGNVENPYQKASDAVKEQFGESLRVVEESEDIVCQGANFIYYEYKIVDSEGNRFGYVIVQATEKESPKITFSTLKQKTTTQR